MRSRRSAALLLAGLSGIACTGPVLSQGAGSTVGGCPVFPGDNIWNARVDELPVDERSAESVASIGAMENLKADFGAGLYEGVPIGIPFTIVPSSQAVVPIRYEPFGDETEAYGEESDPGPYPVPRDAPIEGGPDSQRLAQKGLSDISEL